MPKIYPLPIKLPNPDKDISRAFEWFISFLDPNDWNQRKAIIKEYLKSVFTLHSVPVIGHETKFIIPPNDQIGWYLFLVEASMIAPQLCEPVQASRVLPIFKRLGTHLDILKRISGIDNKMYSLLHAGRNQADSGLFELIIGLLWARNGWTSLYFLEDDPNAKSPDLRAYDVYRGEWFIECKRLKKSSAYSIQESAKWQRMWIPIRDFITSRKFEYVIDVTFHVELVSLADDFMMKELSSKLPLITGQGTIISNATWTVVLRKVDKDKIDSHLKKLCTMYPSPSINELVVGKCAPHKGVSVIIQGDLIQIGNEHGAGLYIESLIYATGSIWECDAERAIQQKARDIRGHLADAVSQLPDGKKGAIHIGLETLDGLAVESERLSRMLETMKVFDVKEKDLRWLFCHLYQSYAPVDHAWDIDETVYDFEKRGNTDYCPLARLLSLLPHNAESGPGLHWLRPLHN